MKQDPLEKTRISADITAAEIESLRKLAAQRGVSMNDALRHAIATESLLQERRKDGSKVLLEKNGNFSELVFNR